MTPSKIIEGATIHKIGGRYGGPGRVIGQTEELDADGYRLYNVAMRVAGGYGEFVHVFPASALSDQPDPRARLIEPIAFTGQWSLDEIARGNPGYIYRNLKGENSIPLFTADEPGLWRFWNEKARDLAAEVERMREALHQALGALKALGAEKGSAADAIRRALGGGGDG